MTFSSLCARGEDTFAGLIVPMAHFIYRRLAVLKSTMLTMVDEVAVQCRILGLVILARQKPDPDPENLHDILMMV